jgi:hypothetical protein
MPEPCPFLSRKFPVVSVIRPVSISTAIFGAMAAVQGFTDDGLFIGHSGEFFKKLHDLAEDADGDTQVSSGGLTIKALDIGNSGKHEILGKKLNLIDVLPSALNNAAIAFSMGNFAYDTCLANSSSSGERQLMGGRLT